jgi:hypothetical protein
MQVPFVRSQIPWLEHSAIAWALFDFVGRSPIALPFGHTPVKSVKQ